MIPPLDRFEPGRGSARAADLTVSYIASGVRQPGVAPLVLIHSAGADAANEFEFLLPMLSRHRLTLALELPVLAGSPNPSTLLEAYRASIDAVLAAESIAESRVAVAGIGMGGTVALDYAAGNSRVERVIAVSSWAAPSQSMILHARIIRRLIIKDPDGVDAYLALSIHSDDFLQTLEIGSLKRERLDPFHRRLFQQSQLMEVLDVSEQLSHLSMPCLIIAASNDRLVSTASSRALANALPNGVATWITTAHDAVSERPAEVLALIDDFLLNVGRHLPGVTVETDRP